MVVLPDVYVPGLISRCRGTATDRSRLKPQKLCLPSSRNASRENGGRLDHHATSLIAASVTAFHSAARSTVHGARQSPPVRRAGQPILTHSPQSLVSKNGESICKVWLAPKPPFCWMSAVLALPSFAQ